MLSIGYDKDGMMENHLSFFRGVKNECFIFNYELQLTDFLSYTEEAKNNYDLKHVIQKQSPLLSNLVAVWGID